MGNSANPRRATVKVHNESGGKICKVTIKHKFKRSGQYASEYTWYGVGEGEYTDNRMTVRYRTGFGNYFSYDWWHVSFIRSINGNSNRSEHVIRPYWHQDTNGDLYKACYLKSKDNGRVVTIHIKKNERNGIVISPPLSGSASTNYITAGSDLGCVKYTSIFGNHINSSLLWKVPLSFGLGTWVGSCFSALVWWKVALCSAANSVKNNGVGIYVDYQMCKRKEKKPQEKKENVNSFVRLNDEAEWIHENKNDEAEWIHENKKKKIESNSFSSMEWMKAVENPNEKGFKNGLFYPHISPECTGGKTIAFGHKITEREYKAETFKSGITMEQAISLANQDWKNAWNQAKAVMGRDVWKLLDPKYQNGLTDLQFNTKKGIRGFPKCCRAAINGDDNNFVKEAERVYEYSPGKFKKLRARNKLFKETFGPNSPYFKSQMEKNIVLQNGKKLEFKAQMEKNIALQKISILRLQETDSAASSHLAGILEKAMHAKTDACNKNGLTVQLRWSNKVDLDLWVVAPSGEKIYHGNKKSKCGGVLDVDDLGSGQLIENISWLKDAPEGKYQCIVHAYNIEKCCTPIEFDVTLNVLGDFRQNKNFSMSISKNKESKDVFTFYWTGVVSE